MGRFAALNQSRTRGEAGLTNGNSSLARTASRLEFAPLIESLSYLKDVREEIPGQLFPNLG